MNGEPAKLYVPEDVPTYTLYPARSGSPLATHVSVALPVVRVGGGGGGVEGGGLGGGVEGGGEGGGGVGGTGGGVDTTGVGACNRFAKEGLA